jgi:hypothetical protein
MEQVRQIFDVEGGAMTSAVRRRCRRPVLFMKGLRGKPGTFRKKARTGNVWRQHGILSLEEPDHRLNGDEVGIFNCQELLDFSAPRQVCRPDALKRLLQP